MSATALFLALALVPAGDDRSPLGEHERILHVLHRFAFGPTPELVAEVRRVGIVPWIEAQLRADAPEPDALRLRLQRLDSIDLSNTDLIRRYLVYPAQAATPEEVARAERLRAAPRAELKEAVLLRAVLSSNQLRETLCDFFRNHFCVDLNKDTVSVFATTYEREVVRGEALGTFHRILRRSAQHPAMLVYLDNVLSRRPPTKAELDEIERTQRRQTGSRDRGREAAEIAKQRGLNENYARELLELHTLGVDNGYTQRDVVEVARALTGWTIQSELDKNVGFQFRPDMHAGGDKEFLGGTIRENRKQPVQEGEQILDLLARHPGTSRFLAWKLCRWFVHDEPSEEMVQRVARGFRDARGDLPAVYRAIVQDPEFFDRRNFLAKLKRPFELMASALRVTNAEIGDTGALQRWLKNLNEPVYECADPTGYYDHAEVWNDPGVLEVRWRFAMQLARGRISGVVVPSTIYEELPAGRPEYWKDVLARRVLSTSLTARTAAAIDRTVKEHLARNPRAGPRDLGPQILALLLGSPEFQRQ